MSYLLSPPSQHSQQNFNCFATADSEPNFFEEMINTSSNLIPFSGANNFEKNASPSYDFDDFNLKPENEVPSVALSNSNYLPFDSSTSESVPALSHEDNNDNNRNGNNNNNDNNNNNSNNDNIDNGTSVDYSSLNKSTPTNNLASPPHRLRTRNRNNVSYDESKIEEEQEVDNEPEQVYEQQHNLELEDDEEARFEHSSDESSMTTTSKRKRTKATPQKRKIRKSNKSATVRAIAQVAAQEAAKITQARANGSKKRKIQTQHVEDEDLDPEEFARLEKNRQSARDCRLRKKQYILGLEAKIEELEKSLVEAHSHEAKLQAEIDRLKSRAHF